MKSKIAMILTLNDRNKSLSPRNLTRQLDTESGNIVGPPKIFIEIYEQ